MIGVARFRGLIPTVGTKAVRVLTPSLNLKFVTRIDVALQAGLQHRPTSLWSS